jgi:hypothetical protein
MFSAGNVKVMLKWCYYYYCTGLLLWSCACQPLEIVNCLWVMYVIHSVWLVRRQSWLSLKLKLNSMALVRERTIPTERPPPVGEVSANLAQQFGTTLLFYASWNWWKCGKFYCCPEMGLWFLWISVACVLHVTFRNLLILNIEELLDFLAPPPRLEEHPLLAVHHSLFNIFLATLHIWRPALHPQHEDVPSVILEILVMWSWSLKTQDAVLLGTVQILSWLLKTLAKMFLIWH